MKGCDKPNSHISSKLHTICIAFNIVRHPVTKTFTTLFFSTLHILPFELQSATNHYPVIWLNLTKNNDVDGEDNDMDESATKSPVSTY
jgi:hypothetical protein